MGELGEICALGHVLAKKSIGVFLRSSLPWRMRIEFLNLHTSRDSELDMSSKFATLVPCYGLCKGVL